ncbi:hypothetical protein BIW11_02114 [Tropilaelaps mercedesae]|uniref:Nbr1 FW domain-containing protein n=1 Tax=Tropilaelaps mercedesae TaxID=418985 RepID=A0A1V9X2U9_9ACAR|nr:hypothetical protein BIW11_02114 [Tropilaelaps mercedesae]
MDPDWDGLLQEFSRMGTTDRDVLIRRMQQLAEGLSVNESAFFLDMNNWNLEAAVWSYFEFNQNLTTTTSSSKNHKTKDNSDSSGSFFASPLGESFPVLHTHCGDISSEWSSGECDRTMKLVEDRTVGNGEAVTPNTPFVKTWRVRNSGLQAWPTGSVFKYVGGDVLQGDLMVELDGPVAPNQEIDISIRLLSPAEPGTYFSQWRLHDNMGPFGDPIWVAVKVQEGGVLALTQQMDACHA